MSVHSIPFVKSASGSHLDAPPFYRIIITLTDDTIVWYDKNPMDSIQKAWTDAEEALLFGEVEGMTKKHLEKLRGLVTFEEGER